MRALIVVAMSLLALTTVTACDRAAFADAQERAAPAADAVVLSGRVVGITDGDTLTLLDAQNVQHVIRLAEIDAPERGQPWGNRSRETLSSLVHGKTVSVQQTDTDRWGRVVGRVFVDGDDVNRAMIEQGAAWAYRAYLTDQTLIAVEERARQQGRGLWSMSDAQTVAPWLWRRGERVGGYSDAVDEVRPQTLLSPVSPSGGAGAEGGLQCSGKRRCGEMASCAEAQFYLRQCGVASLDGSHDGEPCEVLCGTAGR